MFLPQMPKLPLYPLEPDSKQLLIRLANVMSEFAPFSANGAAAFDVAPVPPEATGKALANVTT